MKNIPGRFYWFGIFFFIQFHLPAQSITSTINQDLQLADSLRKAGNFKVAAFQFQKIKQEAFQNNNWDTWYKCFSGLRKIAKAQNRYPAFLDSINYYKTIIPDTNKLVLNKLYSFEGFIHDILGNTPNAIYAYKTLFKNSKLLNDTTRVCYAAKAISRCYSKLDDNTSAIKIVESGIAYLNNKAFKHYLTDFYILKGQYLYYSSKYQEAINHYTNIQNIVSDSIQLYIYLAQAHIKLDQLDIGNDLLNRAEKHLTEQHYKRDWHSIKSLYFASKFNHDEAIDQQKKVLEITSQSRDIRTHLKESTIYAELLFRNNQFEQAAIQANDVFNIYFDRVENSILDLPEEVNNLPEIWLINAAYIKIKYFLQEFKHSNDQKYLNATELHFDFMFQMFEDLKKESLTNNSKYRVGGFSQEIYATAIEFYHLLYQKTKLERYLKKAFIIAQLSNAYVLKNTISERNALMLLDIPLDTINEYLHLKETVSLLDEKRNDVLNEIILPYEAMKNRLSNEYSLIDNYTNETLSTLSNIKSQLRPNEVLIKYFFCENTFYCLSTDQQTTFFDKLVLNDLQLEKLSLFINAVKGSSKKHIKKTKLRKLNHEVYKILLDPILIKFGNHVDQLIIVPDGPIKYIPFAALIQKLENNTSLPEDYLINDYKITYLYYLSQLNQKNRIETNGFIGFGIEYDSEYLKKVVNEYFNKDSLANERSKNLTTLKHAINEVKNCATICGGSFFQGRAVNKKTITNSSLNAKILHFAVHALTNFDDFKDSHILLDIQEPKEQSLSYKDILTMKVNSNLIVLSACQTAFGQELVGEGAMSLGRAFAQSGAQSSLSSLWNVPDKPTNLIMTEFYTNIIKRADKSEALRLAQIEYLTNDQMSSPFTRQPYHWAAWVLYGDGGKINDIGNKVHLSFITKTLICFISLSLIFFFLKKQ